MKQWRVIQGGPSGTEGEPRQQGRSADWRMIRMVVAFSAMAAIAAGVLCIALTSI